MNFVNEIAILAKVNSLVECVTEEEWAKLECDLGVSFPDDYKQLLNTVGMGYFGAQIILRHPHSRSTYAALNRAAVIEHTNVLLPIADEIGIRLYPEAEGLTPVGSSSAAYHILYKRVENKLIDLYIVDQDLREIHRWRSSLSHFLYSLYTGKIEEEWAEHLRRDTWRDACPFFESRII